MLVQGGCGGAGSNIGPFSSTSGSIPEAAGMQMAQQSEWAESKLCDVRGRTVVALQNDGPADLWPTARCVCE